jgi:hypothetical protein
MSTPDPTPIAWCNSAELQDALAKRQSFNGWTQRYDNTDVPLFLAPPPPIPQSHANSMTSENPPLQPLSVEELREQWNSQADHFNEWESLGLDEQFEWAQACAIARDRALRGRLEGQGVASIEGGLA